LQHGRLETSQDMGPPLQSQSISVTRFYLGLIVCNTEETAAYNRDEQELY